MPHTKKQNQAGERTFRKLRLCGAFYTIVNEMQQPDSFISEEDRSKIVEVVRVLEPIATSTKVHEGFKKLVDHYG